MVVMVVPAFGTLLVLYALVFGVPVGAWLLGIAFPDDAVPLPGG